MFACGTFFAFFLSCFILASRPMVPIYLTCAPFVLAEIEFQQIRRTHQEDCSARALGRCRKSAATAERRKFSYMQITHTHTAINK